MTGEERLPVFRPKIDNETIFRELIKAELRNGRLSPWRRRKIVRYAAHLNMSAVEVIRKAREPRILSTSRYQSRLLVARWRRCATTEPV